MHERRQNERAHQGMKSERAAHPELSIEPPRPPRVHEVGLHPPLEPAGALPDPLADCSRRLLPRGRCQDGRAPAPPRHAETEVGILGDVERIPASGGDEGVAAEMVRRAAERYGQAEPRQRGQDGVEQGGVFDGELARQRYYGANAIRNKSVPCLDSGDGNVPLPWRPLRPVSPAQQARLAGLRHRAT